MGVAKGILFPCFFWGKRQIALSTISYTALKFCLPPHFRTDGSNACTGISIMCPTLSKGLLNQECFLSPSLSRHGFVQLTFQESMWESKSCPRAVPMRLCQMGNGSCVSHSTMSDSSENHELRKICQLGQHSDTQSPRALSLGRVPPRVGTDRLCARCSNRESR